MSSVTAPYTDIPKLDQAVGTRRRLDYIPELDGLRAIAVGAVFLVHMAPGNFPGGHLGVDIFFVLSGYLITEILYQEFVDTSRIGLRNFYARRVIRLVPALLALVTVYLALALIAKFAFGGHGLRDRALAALSAVTYFMNWTCAFGLGPSLDLTHTWSLAVEEQFYLVWPFTLIAIFAMGFRYSAWRIVLALIFVATFWQFILFVNGATPNRIYFGFDTRLATLLIGCLIALAPLTFIQSLAGRTWYIPVVILTALCLTLRWDSPVLSQGGLLAIGILSAWLVLAAIHGKTDCYLRVLLRSWPLVYLGKISYGLYLWQMPIGSAFSNHFCCGRFATTKALVATGLVTLLVASMSYYLIERPIRRFAVARSLIH